MKRVSLSDLPEESVSHNPAIAKQVMLRAEDLPPLTNFARARFAPGQVAPGHAHADMAEVFWVESGRGEIAIDGRPHVLAPGTCVAVSPGERHEIANTGREDLVLLYFGVKIQGSPA